MKSQLTFTPEALTCCTLYNHCDYYYLTLLVIDERLNILTMFCYNLHPVQPEEDWPSLRAWFLSRFLPRSLLEPSGSGISREFFLATLASHLTPALLAV